MGAADTFDADFEALMGVPPFRWQRRLFQDHALSGDLPPALDLPTGLGKTSVMAIWYLARRAGAPVPRRLVYVVDRRAVVDQATAVADGIKTYAGDGGLRVSTLRGRQADNREWLADPTVPAIIVGTVDMIGSRLLFSGYGVSRWMRPYHAGLLGSDTLIVVDESHLVPAFERLLEAIEDGVAAFGPRDARDRPRAPPLRLMSLSATGRSRKGRVFRLDPADDAEPAVTKRLHAKKRLTVVSVTDRKLEEAMAERAWAMSDDGRAPVRCLVYCNSRDTADKTKAAIGKLAKRRRIEIEPPELLVGARRVHERGEAAARLGELGFLTGRTGEREGPVFLVSTSAGEVGIDLDADHMVCDAVPWERMVQRLGRVNRRGDGDARIVLVHEGPGALKSSEQRALIFRQSRSLLDRLPADEDGIDVSPGALRDLKLRAGHEPELGRQLQAASTPEPLRPALTRALVDAWSMTSLEQHTGRPEVAPWLRGWVDDEPQTTVVWRRHLPARATGAELSHREISDFFEAAPPHLSEKLETRSRDVVGWLLRRASAAHDADMTPTDPDVLHDHPVAMVLDDANRCERWFRLRDLLGSGKKGRGQEGLFRAVAGKTLVVDARLAGLRDGLLSWADSDAPPRTADGGDPWMVDENGDPVVPFRVRIENRGDEQADPGWHKPHYFDIVRDSEGAFIRRLVVERWKGTATREEDRAIARPQRLAEHQRWTMVRVERMARDLALPDAFVRALTIAARLHDEGKRAARWQRAFNAPGDGGPYAKTAGPLIGARLGGYRHEFGSLRWAECDDEFAALAPEFRDLVLHLIAAHHGRARPVIETKGCDDDSPSALQGRSEDVVLRFARLQKRWGPWGLAWWEALLRAADQQASAENDARASAAGQDIDSAEVA